MQERYVVMVEGEKDEFDYMEDLIETFERIRGVKKATVEVVAVRDNKVDLEGNVLREGKVIEMNELVGTLKEVAEVLYKQEDPTNPSCPLWKARDLIEELLGNTGESYGYREPKKSERVVEIVEKVVEIEKEPEGDLIVFTDDNVDGVEMILSNIRGIKEVKRVGREVGREDVKEVEPSEFGPTPVKDEEGDLMDGLRTVGERIPVPKNVIICETPETVTQSPETVTQSLETVTASSSETVTVDEKDDDRALTGVLEVLRRKKSESEQAKFSAQEEMDSFDPEEEKFVVETDSETKEQIVGLLKKSLENGDDSEWEPMTEKRELLNPVDPSVEVIPHVNCPHVSVGRKVDYSSGTLTSTHNPGDDYVDIEIPVQDLEPEEAERLEEWDAVHADNWGDLHTRGFNCEESESLGEDESDFDLTM